MSDFEAYLDGMLHEQPVMSLERYGAMVHQAAWPDIVEKAKRLIQDGQVTILRNAPHHIMAHVIGDHGEYNTEISRTDPASNVIEQWSCECLLPGQRIVMADGTVKPVEEVEMGDLVMTATGHAGIVGRTFNRHFDGTAIGLRATGSTETVWVTDNHKLPTADYDFMRADEWQEGDYAYLPQPQYSEQTFFDLRPVFPEMIEQDGKLYRANKLYGSKRVTKANRPQTTINQRSKPIPAQLDFTERFARIAGLYVAEGISTPRGELRWHFHPDEMHLVDEVVGWLESLGYTPHSKIARYSWVVSIQSKPLAQAFKHLFGTGSREKRLHQAVMAMPTNALTAFFEAWFEGDGHANSSTGRDLISTASEHLAMQLRLILARLGRESVVRMIEQNSSALVPGGGTLYNISWRRNGGRGMENHFFSYDSVYQKVLKPERIEYSGLVHNFEVLGEHTYVLAPGIASANCPWDQFAFNRTRRWKKFEGRVCSHTLATYWKGLSTPLDFQPDEGGPAPGQNQGPAVDRIPAPGTIPPPSERSFGPETPNPMTGDNYIQQLQQLREQVKQRIKNKQPYLPGENQNLQLPGMRPLSPNEQPPSTQDLIMGPQPETPFRYPEMQQFQRDDLKLFDLNAPPWNPTPVPPQLPVSVPNADPPDAMNPIDGIGFSSIRMIRPIFGATDDDFTTWFQTAKQGGRPTYGQVVRGNVYLEARGGKQPMPEAEPYDFWPDGTPRYRKMDLGYDPATDQRMRADQSGPHGPGAPEQRGVFMAAPLNSRCEVTEIDPMLKWCHIIVPIGNASFLEPNNMEGWVSYADVKPLDDANNPFIRRRGAGTGFAAALEIVRQLQTEGVVPDFALIGSVAGFAQGLEPTFTKDTDLLVLVSSDAEWLALLERVREHGSATGWAGVELAGVDVEFLPSSMNPLYADSLATAHPIDFVGQQIKVANVEHLILLALYAGRVGKDDLRVAALLPKANRSELDALLDQFDTTGVMRQRLATIEGVQSDNTAGGVILPTPQERDFYAAKQAYHAEQASLSFEEKLNVLDQMNGSLAD